jgi:hypothetical protein
MGAPEQAGRAGGRGVGRKLSIKKLKNSLKQTEVNMKRRRRRRRRTCPL